MSKLGSHHIDVFLQQVYLSKYPNIFVLRLCRGSKTVEYKPVPVGKIIRGDEALKQLEEQARNVSNPHLV